MGLDLPAGMERLLNDLGFTWPEVDETELFGLGSAWSQFGSTLGQVRSTADTAAGQISEANQGAAIEAFLQKWTQGSSPSAVLEEAATGVGVGGAAIIAAAGLVLALKTTTIVNIGILLAEIATAIAEAFVTFGASLAEIPVFKAVTQRILDAVVNETINALMS